MMSVLRQFQQSLKTKHPVPECWKLGRLCSVRKRMKLLFKIGLKAKSREKI